MKPRPYQELALNEIRRLFASKIKRVLLQLSTGAGKTFIFSTILNGAKNKGNKCVLVVRGRSLVDQASKRLTAMNVDHSVFMANDKRFDASKLIQVCSVDSVRARKYAPTAEIVVVDEAHTATSKSFRDFLEYYPDAYWLSVTATPWVKGGLRHLADEIIYPISMDDLIAQGYLCPAKYFAPTSFDSSLIKKTGGEFNEESALVQFEKQSVYGDVVKSFLSKCRGEPTFCFAINIAHAHSIQQYFEQNAIRSVVITASTSLVERDFLLQSLVKLEIDCVISVGTMTTGVDVPELKNIIMCRPTMSKNLYIQMLGRGTRVAENKDHFKVIDHVGNVARHGFLVDEQVASLDGPEKSKMPKGQMGLPIKTCPACFAVLKIHAKNCDQCGYVFKLAEVLPKEVDNELKELDLDIASRIRLRTKFFQTEAWAKGRKIGWVWFQLVGEFGEQEMRTNYRIYRAAKTEYESWVNGSPSAPCAFAAFKNEYVTRN